MFDSDGPCSSAFVHRCGLFHLDAMACKSAVEPGPGSHRCIGGDNGLAMFNGQP